jgi:PIN domain nuclease of toxin-antitoxin system
MILLDTCALIWLNDDRTKFSRYIMEKLERNADALAVSPISFMEIGIKERRKGFHLPCPLETWSDKICELYSLTVIPVSKKIAIEAAVLPEIHKDPFDRIIIATAVINKMDIITADKVFQEYRNVNVIW